MLPHQDFQSLYFATTIIVNVLYIGLPTSFPRYTITTKSTKSFLKNKNNCCNFCLPSPFKTLQNQLAFLHLEAVYTRVWWDIRDGLNRHDNMYQFYCIALLSSSLTKLYAELKTKLISYIFYRWSISYRLWLFKNIFWD